MNRLFAALFLSLAVGLVIADQAAEDNATRLENINNLYRRRRALTSGKGSVKSIKSLKSYKTDKSIKSIKSLKSGKGVKSVRGLKSGKDGVKSVKGLKSGKGGVKSVKSLKSVKGVKSVKSLKSGKGGIKSGKGGIKSGKGSVKGVKSLKTYDKSVKSVKSTKTDYPKSVKSEKSGKGGLVPTFVIVPAPIYVVVPVPPPVYVVFPVPQPTFPVPQPTFPVPQPTFPVPQPTMPVPAPVVFDETRPPVVDPTREPLVPTGTPTPAALRPGTVIARINAGSFAFTDPNGIEWSDEMFGSPSPGTNYTLEAPRPVIARTTNPELYWSNRYGMSFSYNIPVPEVRAYTIILHMAELFWQEPGQRIFNVMVEGTVLGDYDIVADVGSQYVAQTYTYTETITDGDVTLDFVALKDMAQVSGIEVIAA